MHRSEQSYREVRHTGPCGYFYRSPEYVSSLLKKFPELKYFGFCNKYGLENSGLPWKSLFSHGAANVGHLSCNTNIEALLWGREDEALRDHIERQGSDKILPEEYGWLYDYLIVEDLSGAEKKFEEAVLEKDKLLPLSIIMFANENLFHERMPLSEARGGSVNLCGLAKCCKWLLGDDNNALRLLRLAEEQCSSVTDRCTIAWMRMELFDDANAARNHLCAASSEAEELGDYEQIAGQWKWLFNDDGAAGKVLLNAEAIVDSNPQLLELIFAWTDLLDDKEQGLRLLKSAEQSANGSCEIQQTAIYAKELLREEDIAWRLLSKAERAAETCAEFSGAAKWWKLLFGESEYARLLLIRAEQKAEGEDELKLLEDLRLEIS